MTTPSQTDLRLFGNAYAALRARPRRLIAAFVCAVVLLVVFRIGLAREAVVDRMASGGLKARGAQNFFWVYGTRHTYMFPPLVIGPTGPMFDQTATATIPAYRIAGKSRVSDDGGHFALLLGELNNYPQYMLKPCVLPTEYLYVGYGVTNEKEGARLIAALRERAADGHPAWEDIPVEAGAGTDGTKILFRACIDLANKLNALGMNGLVATADLAKMPVLIEHPGRSNANGAWAVFLDAHTAYLPYPGPFPMTQSFIEGLSSVTGPK